MCCDQINVTYEFRNKCISSLSKYKDYVNNLCSHNKKDNTRVQFNDYLKNDNLDISEMPYNVTENNTFTYLCVKNTSNSDMKTESEDHSCTSMLTNGDDLNKNEMTELNSINETEINIKCEHDIDISEETYYLDEDMQSKCNIS